MIRKLILLALVLTGVSCKSPDARRPIQRSSSTFIEESVARNKKLIEAEEALIANIIRNDSTNTYLASESGFWYYYNVQDTTRTVFPEVGDDITFTYNIKDLAGKTIVSESENGLQRYKVDQSNQELISGIRDGLKLMKVGETVTFFFPSHKAFGYYGLEDKLGTNVPIQSTVTLKTINSNENN
ncbi:MAG TPA: gliding motility-associated peptidyl-prolyl isomerase GldI [Flavobacteriaceae bacterium]|nr:gliding motility-associated peptidyl-prolyl isomerase GldI [Flavobacteriaceae bacterium]MCB9212429.1 gliding motility-associated peptidyl-prolyl isomerase GldI [Alteromonas sp.]HPF11705.1 gliding motility-associated peptidyl-prolyl isomerase GldI [Flavobacteriaceae bacterium]HQU20180.1 gliding motility-associated peptidyl-prolyl isomerase GldI [Flavobacteriaceae bacterium]HQU64731.1 gliding motility-associated peptidyl-prolyl isomerase GldI [Flavobacteriaceae bacterium]